MIILPEKTEPPELPVDSTSDAAHFQEPTAGPSAQANHQNHPADELPPPYEEPTTAASSEPEPRTPDPNAASFFAKLRKNAGASPAEILSTPPPAFSRQAPNHLSYAPFPPCAVISMSKDLSKGFPPVLPPSSVQPHPFVMHDVQEEDWLRFLSDTKRAGSLSPMNRVVAGVAPVAMGIGLPGFLVSRAIESHMKRKKRGPATELVGLWNHYFFHPRMMEVTLYHGYDVPEDDDSSSSDSEDDERRYARQPGYGVQMGGVRLDVSTPGRREKRAARRAERRERRSERREERRMRRQMRREHRSEKWQLVISYRAPGLLTPITDN